MDIRKLQRVIVNALDDVKAQDIVVYNTKHLTSEFERVIIATGSSNRQTRALGYNVSHEVKELQPAMREYYNLEEVWGGKKVNVKLNSEKKEKDDEKPATARRRVVRGKTIKIVED